MFQTFQIDLTGVQPLGAARTRLPDGGYKVKILDASLERGKQNQQRVNFVVHVITTGEGEYDGVERTVYLTMPDGQDSENDAFFLRKFAALLRSVGAPHSGPLQVSPQLIVQKIAYIQVITKQDDEGRDNENIRFITSDEYARTHWAKRAGGAQNGRATAQQGASMNLLPTQIPQAAAPATGLPAPQANVAPVAAPAVAAPAQGYPVAPVAAPGQPGAELGNFFNAPQARA